MLRLFCARSPFHVTQALATAAPRSSAPRLRALVHGAGPTGCLAALALADAGWEVTLRDPLSAEQLTGRSRAYAFNQSSQRLLARLDLWGALQPLMVPFRNLLLRDQAIGSELNFTLADLPSSVRGSGADAVGWIALHGPLMAALLQRLTAHPAIALRLQDAGETPGAGSGDTSPDLVVAADGPASPHRRQLGIGQWQWVYRQSCLTAQVELRGCGDDQAWELFRPEGPFAVLPLGERRFQLVWSAPAHRCRQLESLPPAAFLDRLAGTLPDALQPDALLDQPRAFPVALQLARRLARGRTLLVGESAHRCHPVGGQGLNLCWRDVACLHRLAGLVAAGRLGPEQLPGRYARRRWPDLLLTLLATDLLVRLFSNRSAPLLPLRRVGIALLRAGAPLRRLSLGVMTVGPTRPW
ncbi:MAG: FAD-dependent monooxygenase [Cyanobium sp. M30B3]|nr:MAG: FAD-dependent monooxygenase [Cyanobium sp. M30B3]